MDVHNTCTKATLFTHHNQQCNKNTSNKNLDFHGFSSDILDKDNKCTLYDLVKDGNGISYQPSHAPDMDSQWPATSPIHVQMQSKCLNK